MRSFVDIVPGFDDFVFAQPTPSIVYNLPRLRRTAALLKEFCQPFGGVPMFSVKANRHPRILGEFAKAGFGADIASSTELELARAAGMSPIVATNPGLDGETLLELHRTGATVYFDSIEQVRLAASKGVALSGHGVRISVPSDYSAFGFEGFQALRELQEEFGFSPRKLHFHCGEIISAEGLEGRLRFIEPYVTTFGADVVDLGGGYGVLSNDFEEMEEVFRMLGALAKRHGLSLIFEFGKVAAVRAGVLVTTVLSRKERGNGQVVFVDSSSFNLGTWEKRHLWKTSSHGKDLHPTRVQGSTCYEHDVFIDGKLLPTLKPGDKLIFSLFGAYAMSINSSLHGLPPPRELFFGD